MSTGQLRIASPTLRGLRDLGLGAWVLPLAAGCAQPRGLAGWVDWRLGGQLARVLREGRFLGEEGERLLMPGSPGVGAERVFVVGLGASSGPSLRLDALMEVVEAGATRIGLAPLPGRSALNEALDWLSALEGLPGLFEEVWLMNTDGSLAEGGPELEEGAERAGLELEGVRA